MSTATLDTPITDADVEAFTAALDDAPPPACEYRDADKSCTEAAAWRLTLRPCRHGWLLCGEHRAMVDLTLSRVGCSCGRCGTRVVARDWMPL